MNYYSKEKYFKNCHEIAKTWHINTLNALQLYHENKIDVKKLYELSKFEKLSYRIEFAGIMNIEYEGCLVTSGNLISIDGNYDYKSSIPYLYNSTVTTYKVRYYFFDGSNLVIKILCNQLKWQFDDINKVFNLELIKIFLNEFKGSRRRKFVAMLKYLLAVRYKGLTFDQLISSI